MERTWRENQLEEYYGQEDELQKRRVRQIKQIDELVEEQTQLREQLVAYEAVFANLQKSIVVSLASYKETKRDIERSKEWIGSNNHALERAEEHLFETKMELDAVAGKISALEQEIASLGKILEFPQ